MDEYLKSLLTLLIGASLPLIGQFVIEKFKRKGERIKYSFEKIINVGEEFYQNSGLALLRFEATLNLLNNINNYNNPDALKIFADAEATMIETCKSIASSSITITAANIYYKVSNVSTVSNAMSEINKAMADFHEIEKTNTLINNDKKQIALDLFKKNIISLVSIINNDRLTIELKMRSLMKIDNGS
jgi:hypothetical protein